MKRQRHQKLASPFAYVSELEGWRRARTENERTPLRRAPVAVGTPFGGTNAHSLAVLPFSNLDRGDETEVMCDGLTEELITTLSQVTQLKVVARSSSFYFKDKAIDVRKVGAKLGVDTVLEGSVRREGDRLRVTAQLSNTVDGCHLWAQRFDRVVSDLFDLQDELARAITEMLCVQLNGGRDLVRRGTREPDLHNLFLKGRYFWNQRTREGLERALDCYEEAVGADPGFAPAHAGIADCHAFLWAYGGYSWDETVRQAEEASGRALALDPESSDVRTTVGLTRLLRYDVHGADRAYRRALELNPGDVRARHWRAVTAANLGRLDDALEEIGRALESDPFGMTSNQDFGRILYFAGRYEEAVHQLDHTLEIAPAARWARIYLGFAYVQLGRFSEALDAFESEPLACAFARARRGQSGEARNALARPPVRGRDRTWRALLHVSLEENERAIGELRAAAEQYDPSYINMCPSVQPLFEPLRSFPEFKALPLA